MSFLQSQTFRNPDSAFFGTGSAPAPAPAPAPVTCVLWTTSPTGPMNLNTMPVGSYTVLGEAFSASPVDFQVDYTGTPANGAFWLIQSNCTQIVTIKFFGNPTPLGTITAATAAEPQIGVVTYQNGTWQFY